MGCGQSNAKNSTAAANLANDALNQKPPVENHKNNDNKWHTKEEKKKIVSDDDWWRQIQEEYKKEKEAKIVNTNRGWANPFGNVPVLSKDVLLGKGEALKKGSEHKKNNSRDISYNQSNVDTTARGKSHAVTPAEAVQYTDDILLKDNKTKGHPRYNDDNVRRNIDGYENLIEDNAQYSSIQNKGRTERANVQFTSGEVPSSTVKFASKESKPSIKNRADELDDLLKDIDSDNDSPQYKKSTLYKTKNQYSGSPYKHGNFDESGHLVLGADFDKSLNKAGNSLAMSPYKSPRIEHNVAKSSTHESNRNGGANHGNGLYESGTPNISGQKGYDNDSLDDMLDDFSL